MGRLNAEPSVVPEVAGLRWPLEPDCHSSCLVIGRGWDTAAQKNQEGPLVQHGVHLSLAVVTEHQRQFPQDSLEKGKVT